MEKQSEYYKKSDMGYMESNKEGHRIVSGAFYFYDEKNKCYWYYREGTKKPGKVLLVK